MFKLTQMQVNSNKVSNYHKSKGMNALCDVSCIYLLINKILLK